MRINTNISALTTQHALNRTSGRADSSMARLSTGLRINSASDDAAGMAISHKLRTQVNGLRMASRNALDGISLVQTAEGALGEVQNMIQRMRELAIQGANDTLQAEDRAAIQREVDQLITEINETSMRTEFNGIRLLSGESDRATASSNSAVSTTSFISDTLDPGNITYDLLKPGLPATITSVGPEGGGGLKGFMEDNPDINLAGMLTINGETIEITANDTPITIANKLRELADRVGVDLHITGDPDGNPPVSWESWLSGIGDATLLLATQGAGSSQSLSISSDNSDLLRALGLPNTSQDPPRGTDAVVSNVVYNGTAVLASVNGNEISITANAGQTIRLNIHTQIDVNVAGGQIQLGDGTTALNFMHLDFSRGKLDDFRDDLRQRLVDNLGEPDSLFADAAEIDDFLDEKFGDITDVNALLASIAGNIGDPDYGMRLGMDILDFGPLVIHVGPNQSTNLNIQLPALNAEGLGLENVNMRSRQGADRAIGQMDEALSRVSEIRSRLGAYQNRLEHTIASLDTTQENATASLSRIEDVDMAQEMSRFTQLNVLSQAGVSILAQANQRPQQILSLLQ